jgi:ABC-2 type transport system ATP-binding protein
MSERGIGMPTGTTLLALIPLVVLVVGVIGFVLVRLWRAPAAPYLPKWLWTLLVVLSFPWGAVVYLVLAATTRPPSEAASTPTGAVHGAAGPAPIAVAERAPSPADRNRSIVATQGLTRDYGGTGLFDVDLRVPAGAVYGLVGPNGAGKTTLLSIITGLRPADRGTVDLDVPRSSVAVCPDVPEFEPWLTAFEVVDLSRQYVAPSLSERAVRWALARAGLADDADRRVGGFSRGMVQRLGLAAAIVGDPKLLILDEPTSALDPVGRAEILDLVSGMRGTRTVIFSSHILADVQRVADHVGVLRAGRLIHQGPTRALVDEHLKPRWSIRLVAPIETTLAALREQPWVRRVEPVDAEHLRVEADSMEHGELGIPEVLSSCRARLVSCEPLAADLEAAFLALTSTEGTS